MNYIFNVQVEYIKEIKDLIYKGLAIPSKHVTNIS